MVLASCLLSAGPEGPCSLWDLRVLVRFRLRGRSTQLRDGLSASRLVHFARDLRVLACSGGPNGIHMANYLVFFLFLLVPIHLPENMNLKKLGIQFWE